VYAVGVEWIKRLWTMSRRGRYKPVSPAAQSHPSSDREARILAYGLPHGANEEPSSRVVTVDTLDIADFAIGHPASFLDYDLVVLFAGAFEHVEVYPYSHEIRYFSQDLDRRHREFFTMLKNRKVFIFLLAPIRRTIGAEMIDPQIDLFRRVTEAFKLTWAPTDQPIGHLRADIADFAQYIDRHGTAHLRLHIPYDLRESCKVISAFTDEVAAGFSFDDRIFFLPARIPNDHGDALQIAACAVHCVLKYRWRMSEELPDWVSEFTFLTEASLRTEVKDLEGRLYETYQKIGELEKLKGVLCFQSDPLVSAVCKILREVFGLRLDETDEHIEDVKILGDNDTVLAMVEIKGVSRNFSREDVNQVDSHRERRGLSPGTPGILIMNTMRNAGSVAAKGERPHPDIIKKAVGDNVLMIRTVDLLRYVNLVQGGKASAKQFQELVLSQPGWLEVTVEGPRVLQT
jgi:hypothetical protein